MEPRGASRYSSRMTRSIPEKFEAAAREFAGWMNLDADAVVAGDTFEVAGVPVTLMHYGSSDPDAATVVIDFGEIHADTETIVLRGLLEHNLRTPAGRLGYFSMAPGLRNMLYCIRVDLEHAQDGADAIGNVVGMAVESTRAMHQSIVQQVDVMQGKREMKSWK
jgi:hypothetical protein